MRKLPKSKRGATRQYNAIMRKCRKSMAGGLSYGMDWPTMRVTFPDEYAHIRKIYEIYKDLPE